MFPIIDRWSLSGWLGKWDLLPTPPPAKKKKKTGQKPEKFKASEFVAFRLKVFDLQHLSSSWSCPSSLGMPHGLPAAGVQTRLGGEEMGGPLGWCSLGR